MTDDAYSRIKHLVLSGYIVSLQQLTEEVSMRQLQRDMDMSYEALSRRLIDPELFTVQEIRELALLLKMEPHEVFKLAVKKGNKQPRKK